LILQRPQDHFALRGSAIASSVGEFFRRLSFCEGGERGTQKSQHRLCPAHRHLAVTQMLHHFASIPSNHPLTSDEQHERSKSLTLTSGLKEIIKGVVSTTNLNENPHYRKSRSLFLKRRNNKLGKVRAK
jgi:hypothetical protein